MAKINSPSIATSNNKLTANQLKTIKHFFIHNLKVVQGR